MACLGQLLKDGPLREAVAAKGGVVGTVSVGGAGCQGGSVGVGGLRRYEG